MRTREEHLQWCKDRANQYLNQNDISQGISSMLSDMSKHPETDTEFCKVLGFEALMSNDLNKAKKFVNGFN